ncbi:MAG: CpsD/CapB family tyrosine-protein kinase [Agathobacter sp.]|nr:CpsD/CapB family tyrosine-protein kinase [Agathobacter sp.]
MNNKIEFYRSESQLMNDAIDRIVVEFHRRKKERGDKTFLLTGCSSEVGTTSVSINLAIALSVAGWNTLLVDCDMRKNDKFKRLNENSQIGLVNYLERSLLLKDILYNTGYEKLSYIPCGATTNISPVRLLCSSKMEKLVEELKGNYDFIIFDFPSIDIVPDADILIPSIDAVALIAAMRKTTKQQLAEAKMKMELYEDKYAGLVINRVDMMQYKKYNHDFDYFCADNLNDKYEKNLKKMMKSKKNN